MGLLQNIHIRLLELDDFQKLKMFHVKHFQSYPISDSSFLSYLTLQQYKTAGAFLNEILVGYIIFLTSDYEADIVYIATHPEYRRMGIGNALLNSKGFTWNICKTEFKIFLEVAVDNIPAIEFYKSQDFKTISLRKAYFKNIDAYLMQKVLD